MNVNVLTKCAHSPNIHNSPHGIVCYNSTRTGRRSRTPATKTKSTSSLPTLRTFIFLLPLLYIYFLSSLSSSSSSVALPLAFPVSFAYALDQDDTAPAPAPAPVSPTRDNHHNNHLFSKLISKKAKTLQSFTTQHIFQPLHNHYKALSPKGKYLSTALVGFTTSRASIQMTVKVIKYTGAVFIISEALNSAGMLNSYNNDDVDNLLYNVKTTITTKLNQCRLLVRERVVNVNMDTIKSQYESCLQQDRAGTLGFTTGVVAALIL